jgi:hypothetical protein
MIIAQEAAAEIVWLLIASTSAAPMDVKAVKAKTPKTALQIAGTTLLNRLLQTASIMRPALLLQNFWEL